MREWLTFFIPQRRATDAKAVVRESRRDTMMAHLTYSETTARFVHFSGTRHRKEKEEPLMMLSICCWSFDSNRKFSYICSVLRARLWDRVTVVIRENICNRSTSSCRSLQEAGGTYQEASSYDDDTVSGFAAAALRRGSSGHPTPSTTTTSATTSGHWHGSPTD